MNHFKTFIFSIILGLWGLSPLAYGQLERPLKISEIKVLIDNVKKSPGNMKSRLFLGTHYYNQNQWKQVITFFGPVAEQLPENELFKLSTSYLNVGEYRESEVIANILLSKKNVKTNHRLLAVEIYSRVLDKLDSEAKIKPVRDLLFNALKSAQKTNPENPKVYDVWLEKLEKHVTHYSFEALRLIDDMKKNDIKLYPRHKSLLCKYNYLAKFTKETKISCKQAIVQEPNNPSNYIYLGQTHVDIGEDAIGKRMLASVGKKFSKSEEALWATADSYYKSKNISSAYTYFKKASRHKDAKPRDYMGLAKTSFELKKYGEALNAFHKHCYTSRQLHHEFRRSSGLLKSNPQWHELYRQKMMDCKPAVKK